MRDKVEPSALARGKKTQNDASLRRIFVRTTRLKGASPVSECEVDGSEAKSTTATSDKKIQDSPRDEGAAIHRNIPMCHPELAAKSIKTKSKRDFMPLPGVSGSYGREM